MGQIKVMGSTGDTKISWNPDNADEVEQARNTYQSYLNKGYVAFRIIQTDGKGKKMLTFDPLAEKVLLIPPLAGGIDAYS